MHGKGLSLRQGCALIGLERSSLYYKRRAQDDSELCEKLKGHCAAVQTFWLSAGTCPDRVERSDRQSQKNIPAVATAGSVPAQKKTEEKAKKTGSDLHVG